MNMMKVAVPAHAFHSMKPTLELEERRTRRLQITLWLVAALIVLALHGGIAWYVLHTPPIVSVTPAEMGAVMIELAPTVEQAASQVDAAVSKPEEAASAAAERPEEERPKEETEEPRPIVKAEEAPVPAVAPLPPQPKEKPKPVEKKPVEKKTPEKPKPEKTAQKPKPTHAPSKTAVRTASAPRSDQRAAVTSAASAGAASSASTPDWKSQVAAALNRNKRYPSGVTATGSPILRVAIAVSGQVSSASVVASSGSPELDRAAIETVHRASPLPPPPSGATMLTFRMNFQSR